MAWLGRGATRSGKDVAAVTVGDAIEKGSLRNDALEQVAVHRVHGSADAEDGSPSKDEE